MTLRRGSNGWARKPRRSLGTDFGAWLDLQPPIVCAGFRTLSLASVQNLGRWNTGLMKLALDRAWTGEWGTMCLKRGSASSNWLNCDWEGLVELSTEMIQSLACVNVTPQSNSQHAKQRDTSRHFRDILIHSANKASVCCLSLQLKMIFWYRVLLDGPAWCIEEILAIKPICENSPSCDFWRWRLNNQRDFDDAAPELHTEQ